MKKTIFEVSFRCQYPAGNETRHKQPLKLSEIQKWIEAYKFTHPDCKAISCKIWFADATGDED